MADTGSQSLQLNKDDLKKAGKGLVIALLGALLTYISVYLKTGNIEQLFGVWTPIIGALFAVLVNLGWKWIKNNASAQAPDVTQAPVQSP